MPKEFHCEVIDLIKTEEMPNGEIRLHVVSWNRGEPKLEYRRYYEAEGGEMKPGKLAGISYGTLQTIEENLDRIKKAMGVL